MTGSAGGSSFSSCLTVGGKVEPGVKLLVDFEVLQNLGPAGCDGATALC